MNIILLENDNLIVSKSEFSDVHLNIVFVDISETDVKKQQNYKQLFDGIGDLLILSGSANYSRKVISLHAVNKSLIDTTISLNIENGSVETQLGSIKLKPNEYFELNPNGLQIYTEFGEIKSVIETKEDAVGYVCNFIKIGTSPESTGVMYSFLKDAGTPGALTIGTPGIGGRIVGGATEPGSIYVPDVVDKSIFLRQFNISSSIAGVFHLFDLLWLNSGLSVTTTTAQSITQPLPPPRIDFSKTLAGLLVTTATTYASPVSNIVISYTNEKFVSGRVGTMPSFPGTAVVGTFVPFLLAAGDKGISSIQSITFPTSLTSGAISLIMFEQIFSTGIPVTYVGSNAQNVQYEIPIKSNACLLPFWLASTTSTITIMGNLYFVYKNN